ncbi:CUB domain protein, partial [Teladorsagia circumcincta]
ALNFTGSLDCIWLLEVPHEYSIVLYINEFSLYAPNHCSLNFFEVYSGTTSDKPLKRYCGMTAAHVFTSHYLMYVRFYLHDANRIRNTSISALYSSFTRIKNCSSTQLLSCGDENCVPRSLACNGRINCPYGNDEMNCHTIRHITVHTCASGLQKENR